MVETRLVRQGASALSAELVAIQGLPMATRRLTMATPSTSRAQAFSRSARSVRASCARQGCTRPVASSRARYCSPACRQAAYRSRASGPQHRQLITLRQGDARELLRAIPSGSVNLIVTDPPYAFERGSGSGRFSEWFAEISDAEWPAMFRELARVLASPGHCYVFADNRIRNVFDAAAREAGLGLGTPLIWDKQSPGLAGIGAAWRPQYELVLWFSKGGALPVASSSGNVLRHARVRGYPTEKPVAVLEQIIRRASAPGALVLDPFCGSGSVGRAARRLGRRALLIDVDTTTAERRLRVTAERSGRCNPQRQVEGARGHEWAVSTRS